MRSPLASPFRGGFRNLTPMRARGRGGVPWTPANLAPYAWYDAELGQPKNVGYVQLDGTSGDYITTPDSAALSFSNDIEVVMRVYCNDWSAAAIQTLVGKYVTTSNQRSWKVASNTSGQIIVTVSVDGTTTNTATITPSVALPDSTWIWLRARMDLTDGSNSVGTIETAADNGSNGTEPSSWAANGTATATALAGIFDSTAPLEIGSFQNGTSERFSGRVGRCIVRSGFAGTTVADFNADDCYGPGYTGSLGNAWTLGLPKIYDRSGNNRAPAVFAAGSNQPLWLPWKGRSQVYLPGSASNWVQGVNVDHTGDFTARVFLTMNTAGPTNFSEMVSDRLGATGEAIFRFAGGDGTLIYLNMLWWQSGVAAQATSTDHGVTTGTDVWFGVERINNSGGVWRVRFYKTTTTSPSMSDWTGWTLISEHFGAAAASPSSSSAATYVGGPTVGYSGAIYKAVTTNNGSTVVDFDASLCGQSGYGSYTISRSTSGRKAVVQSPVANSARSVILHGTDDRFTVPAAALPTFGTSGTGAVLAVQRKWATLGTNDRVLDSKASTSATAAGFYVGSGSTAADLVANAGDGTNQANSTATTGIVSGERQVGGLTVSATQVQAFVNNTFASAASRPAGSMDSGGDLTVMANSTGAEYSDGTVEAIIVRGAGHTAIEQGQLVAYYRGGL